MNRIKLFGTVENVSDLKFDISSKLKVYMELEIKTICGSIFKCIAYEKLCEKLRKAECSNHIYLCGFITYYDKNEYIIILNEIHLLI